MSMLQTQYMRYKKKYFYNFRMENIFNIILYTRKSKKVTIIKLEYNYI